MRVTPNDIRSNFTFRVFLDGMEVEKCVMADEERGEVEVLVYVGGKYVIDGDKVKTEILTGEVFIEKRCSKCG